MIEVANPSEIKARKYAIAAKYVLVERIAAGGVGVRFVPLSPQFEMCLREFDLSVVFPRPAATNRMLQPGWNRRLPGICRYHHDPG
jgi:hypothetical protein